MSDIKDLYGSVARRERQRVKDEYERKSPLGSLKPREAAQMFTAIGHGLVSFIYWARGITVEGVQEAIGVAAFVDWAISEGSPS